MADKTPKAKRRVRNPETFRERALKAGEAAETASQKQRGRVRQAVTKPFKPLAEPLGRLARLKPFQVVGKVLRFVGRILFPRYFRQSWTELRQVTWPSWRQSRQLTFAVMIFAIIFGGLVALVDLGLDKAFKQLLLK